MKKFLGLFLGILCLGLVTGCGSKNTITCTTKEDGQEVKVVATVDKDDKITNIKMETSMKADSKEELDAGMAILQMGISMYDSMDGVKASVKKSGLTATIVIDVDLKKVSKDTLEELDLDDATSMTGTAFKKNAEEDGATCK